MPNLACVTNVTHVTGVTVVTHATGVTVVTHVTGDNIQVVLEYTPSQQTFGPALAASDSDNDDEVYRHLAKLTPVTHLEQPTPGIPQLNGKVQNEKDDDQLDDQDDDHVNNMATAYVEPR